MLLLLFPDPGQRWQEALAGAAPNMELLVPVDEAEAIELAGSADALYGQITLRLLAAASRLRWIYTQATMQPAEPAPERYVDAMVASV